jgi:hypothetical protein
MARKLDYSTFQFEIRGEAQKIADEVMKDFQKTVRTWNEKPRFFKRIEVTRRGVNIVVGTDNQIYKYVNNGTRVRYAVMSRNFRAKTRPGVIGSSAGRGGLVIINRNRPRPGIEARRFDQKIYEKWKPAYKRRIGNAVRRGQRAAFRRG